LIAAFVLAISVAAPEMDAPAGAVVARSSARAELQARPAARSDRVAKRRKRRVVRRATLTAAQRKARLQSYFRAHPGVVAMKLGKTPVKTAKKPLKKKPKKKLKKKKPLSAAAKRRAAAAARKRRALAAAKKRRAAAAKKRKLGAATKKQPVKKHPLGTTGWTELALLALLPFGAVGAVLLGTDRARHPREPRAPSPSKRRRTLVITPMRGRR
jgi:hypothetical protein